MVFVERWCLWSLGTSYLTKVKQLFLLDNTNKAEEQTRPLSWGVGPKKAAVPCSKASLMLPSHSVSWFIGLDL